VMPEYALGQVHSRSDHEPSDHPDVAGPEAGTLNARPCYRAVAFASTSPAPSLRHTAGLRGMLVKTLRAELATPEKCNSNLGTALRRLEGVTAVVSDLDGTLLRSGGSLSQATATALRTARDAGVEVLIATARTPRGIRKIPDFEELGVVVCANGAVVWDARRRKSWRRHRSTRTLSAPRCAG
jgi:hypothetical protein